MATKDTAHEITFNVGGWATCSGATKVRVVLDPEGDDLRVYTFNAIGAGTPMAVWHNRHRVIATVDVATVPDGLLEALKERSDEIRAIAALYLGAEWNGSNHIGRWSDDGDGRWSDDLELDQLPTYWDAGDWFGGDPHGVVATAIEAGRAGLSLTEIAENEVECAADNDVILDADDAEASLRWLLERHSDEIDDDDDDHPVIAKILGKTPEYTYTIFDGNPAQSGQCAWPGHEDEPIKAASPEEALAEVLSIARDEASGCEDYRPGDRLWAIVWDVDGTVVAEGSTLVGEPAGCAEVL